MSKINYVIRTHLTETFSSTTIQKEYSLIEEVIIKLLAYIQSANQFVFTMSKKQEQQSKVLQDIKHFPYKISQHHLELSLSNMRPYRGACKKPYCKAYKIMFTKKI